MGVVDEVKDRIDIVDFISNYVALKKAGRTYKGLCPFHAEKTPSFVVFPHTQTWHCFGACGTGGDIFTFLQRHDGLDFSEALEELAHRAGVPLAPPSPQAEESDKQRALLREMHVVAAQYYHHLLRQSPEAQVAREYVAERGLTGETIENFQLGYAPGGWEGLKSYLIERGYNEDDLVVSGLLVKKEQSESCYDRFRNRLMIPIRDRQGHVIAFGARALAPNDVPKYLNSPQTPVFDKSGTLFGLDMAKDAVRDLDQVVLVEGYMDVLSAHQAGYRNVVAGMGTALTEMQLKQVDRLTTHLVLALDADTAGGAATLRGIDTARQSLDRTPEPVFTPEGLVRFESRLKMDIRIAVLPPGRDPDDVLRQTPQEWPQIVDTSLPVISYYMRTAAKEYDLTTAKGKSGLVRQVLPLLQDSDNAVERSHYISQLAQLVKVEEKALLADLEQMKNRPNRPQRDVFKALTDVSPNVVDQNGRRLGKEEYILALVLKCPQALEPAKAELDRQGLPTVSSDDFNDSLNQSLFPLVVSWVPSAAGWDLLENVISQADPMLLPQLEYLKQQAEGMPDVPLSEAPAEIVGRILKLRSLRLQSTIGDLRFLLSEAATSSDEDEVNHYEQLVLEATRKRVAVERAIYERSPMGKRHMEASRQGLAR